jgi:hypothetical protein
MMPPLPVLLEHAPAAATPTVILYAGGEEVAMIAIIMGSLSVVAFPLVRALARRLDSKSSRGGALSGAAEQRLERMERAIDSIAIEVERISEAQRFTTKLLADRNPPAPREELPR